MTLSPFTLPPFTLPPFVLVTGNLGKVREAERFLGYRPRTADIDLPELQSLDIYEILRAKADEAWRRLGEPLVVDETALGLAALAGFPGPLVKWMLEAVGPAGIARTAHALGDDRATATCALLYRDGERTVVATGEVAGRLVAEPRGTAGFGWDPVFLPDDSAHTFGEMSLVEKERHGHRSRAWRDLLKQWRG